ncbi:hypothetical protein LOTGIDRAFT_233560 [Lottia gigantea]|uniref:Glycerophosphocholine acyltransferase 1 n=1 Tax=Lottia gigantea TaxID=225164 RepID=V3ZIH3_LOTGI|nr:hypothetical protein LOTGIDRAFT_233560 [Lottia gigantea]ESO91083.1 hypothetical protein LOTGIDRAFT_233560 [Lottia gigantea]
MTSQSMNYNQNILIVKPVDTVVTCTNDDGNTKPVASVTINGFIPRSSSIGIEPTKSTLSKLEITESGLSQEEESELAAFLSLLKRKRLQEKLVYVISIGTIILLTHSLMASQWLLPYYYTISTPCLLLIRTIIYWKFRWHYFLLDFCYYGNILWFAFIWIAPHHGDLFSVAFAIANGPLLWAMVIYRNSLVLHSIDKVTSVYIHILPAFLSFVIRWYPEESSSKWPCHFIPLLSEWSFIWLVAVPAASFIGHNILVTLLTCICKPPEHYQTSYRYLTSKTSTFIYRAINLCGPKYRILLYLIFNWLFCLASFTMTILWYNYFIAHIVYLSLMFLVITFNGARFYLDVFSVRPGISG